MPVIIQQDDGSFRKKKLSTEVSIKGDDGTAGSDGTGLGRSYFLKETASDISGYSVWHDEFVVSSFYDSATFDTADGETLIEEFATATGDPGISYIPSGTWRFNLYYWTDTISLNTRFIIKVYTYETDTTETLIFSTESDDFTELSAITLLSWDYAHSTDLILAADTRLVVKVYAQTGSASNVEVRIQGGTTGPSNIVTQIFTGPSGAAGATGATGAAGSDGADGDDATWTTSGTLPAVAGMYIADDSSDPLTSTLTTTASEDSIVDGVLDVQYTNGIGTNFSIGADYGLNVEIEACRFYDDGDEGAGIGWFGANDQLDVYSSDDNVTWVLREQFASNTRVATGGTNDPYYIEVTLASSFVARYVKVYASDGPISASNGNSVDPTEFRCIGTNNPAAFMTLDHVALNGNQASVDLEAQNLYINYDGVEQVVTLLVGSAWLYTANVSSPTSQTLSSASSNLGDGNLSSEVLSAVTTKDMLGIDLASALTVHTLRRYDGNTADHGIYGGGGYDVWKVYKSSDNATWTLVETFDPVTRTDTGVGNVHYVEVELTTPASARYWAVWASDTGALAAGGGGAQLNCTEFQVRGIPSPDEDSYLYFWDGGAKTGQSLQWDDDPGRFVFSDDLVVDGDIYTNNLYLNYDGPDQNAVIYFYDDASPTGGSLLWNNASTRFEFSDPLSMSTNKIVDVVDPTSDQDAATKKYVDDNGGGTLQATTDSGNTTTNDIKIQNLYLNFDGPDQNAVIYFYDDTSPTGGSLLWNNASTRFEFSNQLSLSTNKIVDVVDPTNNQDAATKKYVDDNIGGGQTLQQVTDGGNTTNNDIKIQNLYLNYDGPDQNAVIYFYDDSSPTGGSLLWNNASTRFEFSNQLSMSVNKIVDVVDPTSDQDAATKKYVDDNGGGTLQATTDAGNTTSNDIKIQNLYLNYDGGDHNTAIYFYDDSSPTGGSLIWNDTNTGFEFSHTLEMNATKITGVLDPTADQDAATKKYVDDNGGGTLQATTDLGNTTSNDIKIQNLYLNYDGPDQNAVIYFYDDTSPTGGSLLWNNASTRFEFSHGIWVDGDITASGTIQHSLQNAFDVGKTITNATSQSTGVEIGDGTRFLSIYTNGTNSYLQFTGGVNNNFHVSAESHELTLTGHSKLTMTCANGDIWFTGGTTKWIKTWSSEGINIQNKIYLDRHNDDAGLAAELYMKGNGAEAPSNIRLQTGEGSAVDYYFWVDQNGKYRVHTSYPTDEDADGNVVGPQTLQEVCDQGAVTTTDIKIQNLYLNFDGPDQNAVIYFYDDSSPTGGSLLWNNASTRFEFSNQLSMSVNKIVDVVDPTADQDAATKKYVDDNIGGGQTLQQVTDGGNTTSNDIKIQNLYLNYDGGDHNTAIYFYDDSSPTGGSLIWNDTNTGFEFSHTLEMNATKITGVLDPTNNQDAATKKYVDDNGTLQATTDLGNTTSNDIKIQNLYLNYDGPDQNAVIYFYDDTSPTGGSLLWNDASTRFEFSHTLEMNATKITGVLDPTSDQDAATKKYVDDNGGGGGTLQTVTDSGDETTNDITASNLKANAQVYINYDGSAGSGELTPSAWLYTANVSSPTSQTLGSSSADLGDGNLTTQVLAAVATKDMLGVDLGSSKEVTALRRYDANTSGDGIYAAGGYDAFTVYKSSDNSTWTLVEEFHPVTRVDSGPGNAHYVEVTLASPATERYWAIYASQTGAIASAAGAQLNCTEFEVYGTTAGGGEGDSFLYFWDAASTTGQSLQWDDDPGRFVFSTDLAVDGHIYTNNLYLNYDGPDLNAAIYFYDDASPTGGSLLWNDTSTRFEFSHTLEMNATKITGVLDPVADQDAATKKYVDDSLPATQTLQIVTDNGNTTNNDIKIQNLYLNYDGPDQNAVIYFYDDSSPTGGSLLWNNASTRFEFSNQLSMSVNKIVDVVDPTNDQDAATKKYVDDNGGATLQATTDLGNTTSNDIKIQNLYLNYDGPDHNAVIYFYDDTSPTGGSLLWNDASTRFEFSHTLEMNATKITGVLDPTADQDAATKKYVDDAGGGGDRLGVDVLVVEPGGAGDYTTIQAALTASASGDIIFIMPGTYSENIILEDNVSLVGLDRDLCIITNSDAVEIMKATTSEDCTATVTNMTIIQTNAAWYTITTNAGSGTWRHTFTFRNCFIQKTLANSGRTIFNEGTVYLYNCEIYADLGYCIYTRSDGTDVAYVEAYDTIMWSGNTAVFGNHAADEVYLRNCQLRGGVYGIRQQSGSEYLVHCCTIYGGTVACWFGGTAGATEFQLFHCHLSSGTAALMGGSGTITMVMCVHSGGTKPAGLTVYDGAAGNYGSNNIDYLVA